MKKTKKIARHSDGMRKEYDLTGGVRGKYAHQFMRNSNVVVLDPDISEAFPDSKAVNEMLRVILQAARRQVGS